MKQFLLCLFSLTFFNSILCMNKADINGSNSDDEELDIIEIQPERWPEFSLLDEQARLEYSEDGEDSCTPQQYQEILANSLNNKRFYVVFAQENKKLIGMAGAMIDDPSDTIATIHTDYASNRLEELSGHAQMIEALLAKIAHSGIQCTQVEIPSCEKTTISFYKQLGFVTVATDNDQTLLEKKLALT